MERNRVLALAAALHVIDVPSKRSVWVHDDINLARKQHGESITGLSVTASIRFCSAMVDGVVIVCPAPSSILIGRQERSDIDERSTVPKVAGSGADKKLNAEGTKFYRVCIENRPCQH